MFSPISPPLSPLIPSPNFEPYEIETLLGFDADNQLDSDLQDYMDNQLSTRIETVTQEIFSPSQPYELEQEGSSPSTPTSSVDEPSPALTPALINTITVSTATILMPVYFQTPLILWGEKYLLNPFASFSNHSQPAQTQNNSVLNTPVATALTLVPVKTEKVSSQPEKPQNSVRNPSVSITPARVPVKTEQASTTTTSSNIKQNGQPRKYRAILPKPSNMGISKK